MPNLINIEKFFLKSNCCNGQSTPCQNSAPADRAISRAQDYFKFLFDKDCTLYAGTITIGNKYYGSMSADQQYKHFVKAIKGAYGGHTKYLFYFELTKVGILHAHGVIDGYQSIFIDHFNKFGRHNTNDKSYQEIKTIDYFTYIEKEYKNQNKIKYKPITNVTKIDTG